eukprot:1153677-Pelagomonas_calceolata.AAC.3
MPHLSPSWNVAWPASYRDTVVASTPTIQCLARTVSHHPLEWLGNVFQPHTPNLVTQEAIAVKALPLYSRQDIWRG